MLNSKLCPFMAGTTFLLFSLTADCGGAGGGASQDARLSSDSGVSLDSGSPTDARISSDAPVKTDAKVTLDILVSTDVQGSADAQVLPDAGISLDGGNSTLPVNLGTAGNFVILAKSGISTVPTSVITGDLGISPASASYITGFSLTVDATNVFSTSPQVTGKVYAADYASPTSFNLTTAVGDMGLAFTDAAGRAPDVTELGAGNIGGMTLAPGIYKWSTGLLIPTDVTLNGGATDVWIFQIAQDLTFGSAAKVLLAGGALPQNAFWQVSGLVDLGTTAHCEGVILGQTSITLRTGASIKGRLLAQTAVNIDGSTVVEPAR